VYLVFHYAELLRRPIEQIRLQLEQLQGAEACIDRIGELLVLESAIADGTGPPLPAAPLSVRLEDVDFRYGSDPPVLTGLRVSLDAGRRLGVVGRTGSGKTTLARLLVRQLDARSGRVRVGERPIESIPLASLRERVAAVTQDVQLFQASVRDNVRLFDPRIGDDRIREALAAVEMADWLAALPDGLDTGLGAGGVGLSAGEAQLVAMARVFLRDPGLVLLDEASSRLDPVTARRVERATARLVRGRTAVVIAHRLATLEHVDEILVLEEGRVVEHGERADLLADPASRLRRLVETAPRERASAPA
jgi:ATP-binding cassette subfamily B protein